MTKYKKYDYILDEEGSLDLELGKICQKISKQIKFRKSPPKGRVYRTKTEKQKWLRYNYDNDQVTDFIKQFKKKENIDIKLDFRALCDRVTYKHIARWRKNG